MLQQEGGVLPDLELLSSSQPPLDDDGLDMRPECS